MALKKGDIVELAAPSAPPHKKRPILQGMQILKSWGLRPHLPKEAISPYLFHAAAGPVRARLLEGAFLNPRTAAVWALRGGYGAQKLAPQLAKKLQAKAFAKKAAGKLFIGFSDSTALHLCLNKAKIPSLHAPFVSQLHQLPQKELVFLRKILFGEAKQIVFPRLKSLAPPKNSRRIKGPLAGGNLTLIQNFLGTPWLPSFQSSILFLEDVHEEGYRVDRALHHLFFAGALKGLKALVLGPFPPLSGRALRGRVLKSFAELSGMGQKIPIVTGLPCGHISNHRALPLGVPAELLISPSGAAQLKTASISMQCNGKHSSSAISIKNGIFPKS